MNRTGKQFAVGFVFLIILALIIGGIWFFYFKPAPSCTDNKQNQKEIGIDCGGPCIPCEVKGVNLVTEELKTFPAGKDETTLLVKIRNPSLHFSAKFYYQFELGGALPLQSRELVGRETLAPGATEYVVVPNLAINPKDISGFDFNITELNWSEEKSLLPNIRISRQTNIVNTKVTVTGVLFNDSAVNLATINLTVLLFNTKGETLNVSLTQLENVEAFSQKPFSFFFPEVEGLTKDIDPQKTVIRWDLND